MLATGLRICGIKIFPIVNMPAYISVMTPESPRLEAIGGLERYTAWKNAVLVMYGAKSTAKDKAVVNRAFLDAVLRDPSGRLGRSSSMPPFPALTEEERAALAAYLESLSAHAAHADMPGMDHGAHK